MTQSTVFDAIESANRKQIGMAKASSFPFDQPISRARNIAILLAKRNGETHADAVYQYLAENLPDVLEAIPDNGWGSVFKSPRLKFSGRVRESEKVSRHSGLQRIWLYNP